MQRGRGGMGDFFGFGDPFAGFGRPGGLISSFLGGRDPFDDPFFTTPMRSMFGPSFFGASPFGLLPQPFGLLGNGGYLEEDHAHAHAPPQPKKSKGPVIREINSDGEEEEAEEEDLLDADVSGTKYGGSRKHPRPGKEAYVLDAVDEKRRKQLDHAYGTSSSSHLRPQTQAYTFQSTSVTYGGPDGAYYTSSMTRKTGGDGVTFEECKEADATTGKATHRILKGLHDKGHSVTRKLNSDGRVDTMQTLHNLNQDELLGFEKAWNGNVKKHIPGWKAGIDALESGNTWAQSSGSSGRSAGPRLTLPSTVQQHPTPSKRTGLPKTYSSNSRNRRV